MPRIPITGGGAFTAKNIADLNTNFTQLFAGALFANVLLTNAQIIALGSVNDGSASVSLVTGQPWRLIMVTWVVVHAKLTQGYTATGQVGLQAHLGTFTTDGLATNPDWTSGTEQIMYESWADTDPMAASVIGADLVLKNTAGSFLLTGGGTSTNTCRYLVGYQYIDL